MEKFITFVIALLLCQVAITQKPSPEMAQLEREVIEWRHHFHQYPELSNREFNTAKYISQQLKKMDIEHESGIAHTGVVGYIKGDHDGPTVALRADIDALPVVERVDLPWASKERTEYLGEEVGVMHACGHDTHTAMLLGAAKLLKADQANLHGNIVLIFQPAEEGAPPGEEGGAKLMVDEGVLEKYKVDVIFGQHISSGLDVGKINYKVGGAMAASDRFVIKVKGKQAHGSRPWSGIDPITISAQIIMGLQTIVSRQTELTKEAAVITVGKIAGGVRNNIIPEEVEMVGTIRTLDVEMQEIIHEKIRKTATLIAEAGGATAEVDIQIGNPVTYNNPELTRKMIQTLFDTAGEDNVRVVAARTGAEDFSFFAQKVPGLYWFLGGKPASVTAENMTGHHTPEFYVDDAALMLGVKTMKQVAIDYMHQEKEK